MGRRSSSTARRAPTAMKDEAAKLRIVLGCKTVEKKPTTPPPTR
jgi:hypothetical protein